MKVKHTQEITLKKGCMDLQFVKPTTFFDANAAKYRIQTANKRFLNAGTDKASWFTLETAKRLVNYSEGEKIVEHDGTKILWEIL